jgi:hypothetical protein
VTEISNFVVRIEFLFPVFPKYAANLWVWNTPRDGYSGNPKNPNFKGEKEVETMEKVTEDYPGRVGGTFTNSGKDPAMQYAKLYYVDLFWADLGFGDVDVRVNTYPGHVWNVKVDGKTVHRFEIKSSEPTEQLHTI